MSTVARAPSSRSNPDVTNQASTTPRSIAVARPVRIAMWSGPRNISTAMMRSWGSRPDTMVVDEPFYAHYLSHTGLAHPGRDEVIRCHDSDWQRVAEQLTGPVPGGHPIYYQKHMAHHVLEHMTLDWMDSLTHAFLIREPRAMLVSLGRVLDRVRLEDTGLPQQLKIHEHVRARTGTVPPVIDSRDVLENPRGMLEALCDALGVAFDAAMLRWEPGPRDTDGVWARHWYAAVEASTGFAPYKTADIRVPDELSAVARACEAIYARLAERRLRA